VPFPVVVFYIKKDKIAGFRHGPENFRGGKGRGFYGPVNAPFSQLDEQVPRKIVLNQDLPPGKGYAAAGFLVKNPVFQADTHNFGKGIPLSPKTWLQIRPDIRFLGFRV
jgi:hypothetical protein